MGNKMRLIGMVTSPFVRRVAIMLRYLDIAVEHESVGVFRDLEYFQSINPVVKAPTLVTDDGVVLMDSTLILDHIQHALKPAKPMFPSSPDVHAYHHRILGLALAGCEKTVQLVYERTQRPEERRHEPWIERVRSQASAAFALLEQEVLQTGAWMFGDGPMLADVTAAVTWTFAQTAMPDLTDQREHPKLAAFASRAEEHQAFRAFSLT